MDLQKLNKALKILFVLVAVIIGGMLFVNSVKNNKAPKVQKIEKGFEHETAYYAAQQIIKQGLKVPRSAKFQNRLEGVDISYKPDLDEYILSFWGEADNLLGVTVRKQYLVTIKHHTNGDWKIINSLEN